jgi:hypothetical protein
MFLSVDGGRSRIFSSGTARGSTIDVFMLMVGALGSPAPAPPEGPPSTFFSIDGGRSWIFSYGTS